MIKIDVKGVADVQRKLKKLQSDLQDKALRMAINKTAEKARAEIARAVPQEFAITAAEVRSAIDIRRMSSKGRNRFEARLDIFGSRKKKGRSLNLIHFLEKSVTMAEAKRRAKRNMLYGIGLHGRLLPVLGFKFKKGGGTKHIEGAFIGNKGRTVFVRTGDKRLPIKPEQMIGVSQMYSTEKIKRRVMEKVKADLVVEVDRAVRMLLERRA